MLSLTHTHTHTHTHTNKAFKFECLHGILTLEDIFAFFDNTEEKVSKRKLTMGGKFYPHFIEREIETQRV